MMDDASSASRLIILGGCPRSGTTLVQNMLDSHPEVLGGPEFLHLADIIRLRTRLQTSVSKEWIDMFCSNADVDEHIRHIIESLLLPLADQNGARYLSEKSPDNVKVLVELAELFPHTKIVHIVRDPRAVVASLLATGRRAIEKEEIPASFARDTQAAVRYTARCLRAGFRASDAYPDRVYTVVYEALVSNPLDESKKLCDFLGIDWSSDMLNPAGQTHLGEAAITVNSKEIWYDKSTYYSNPNTSRIDAWREELTPYQQILAIRTFSRIPQLQSLGYDFKDPRQVSLKQFIGSAQVYAVLLLSKMVARTRQLLDNFSAP